MKKTKRLKPRSTGSRIATAAMILVLLVLLFLAIMPFVYMFSISLMPEKTNMKLTWNELQNTAFTFDNYRKIFVTGNFGKYILNSFLVAIIACVLGCLSATMSAYAFAKKKFPGAKRINGLYTLTMMVPGQVMIIPLFVLMRNMGLLNTHLGVALPAAASAFSTMMMYSFMKSVPNELLEAADIDGCGELRKFTFIVLPLVKTAIISLAIFIFISCWSDLLWPMLSLTDPELSTVTMAVAKMKSAKTATNFGYVMAGSTLAFLPPFILYILLQKEFVEGIALSGTKT